MLASIQAFRFVIRFKEEAHLPRFIGGTLRGGFGYAFKRVVCALRRQTCQECLLRSRCAYAYVFETPPPSDSQVMRLYPSVPHPYVLEPALIEKTHYLPGETLEFRLLLIGKAQDLLPYFVYTFLNLGESGLGKQNASFDLIGVWGVPPNGGTEVPLYDADTQNLKPFEPKYEFDFSRDGITTANHILIRTRTMLRLKREGTLTDKLPFDVLVRNLIRRIASLLYFHCDGDPNPFDFKNLIQLAEKVETVSSNLHWEDVERYSTRQHQKMNLGGLMGEVDYRGNLDPFMAFIRFGSLFHIGKGSSFGLGQYTYEILDI